MTHILYRPHVVGPENKVTTPDIVVDRVLLDMNGEQQFLPVHHTSQAVELQLANEDTTITPAFAVIACGGGALLGLAAIVRFENQPLAIADVLIARSAWRLRNVIDHIGELRLDIECGSSSKTVSLSTLPELAEPMRESESGELEMPRGIIGLYASSEAALSVPATVGMNLRISDPALNRSLSHNVSLISVDADRWNERPLPRYTVGPVGDVEHFI